MDLPMSRLAGATKETTRAISPSRGGAHRIVPNAHDPWHVRPDSPVKERAFDAMQDERRRHVRARNGPVETYDRPVTSSMEIGWGVAENLSTRTFRPTAASAGVRNSPITKYHDEMALMRKRGVSFLRGPA